MTSVFQSSGRSGGVRGGPFIFSTPSGWPGVGPQQPTQCINEADAIRRRALERWLLRLHDAADQIVQQHERENLLATPSTVLADTIAMPNVLFQIAEIDLDLPSLAVEFNEFLGGILFAVQQRGDDPCPLRPKSPRQTRKEICRSVSTSLERVFHRPAAEPLGTTVRGSIGRAYPACPGI